jgi:class 3 adenylate cyclase/pimeloyl-ACP methyl ester carboxylesterase
MDFYEVLDQVVNLLQRRGRVTYRALKLQFQLDDEQLEALKDELCYSQPQIVEDADRGLVWTGGAAAGAAPTPTSPTAAPVPPPAPEPQRAPRSYTPTHLAEKILTAQSTLEGERKQVTVLFADIKDSTELITDLDPEAAQQLLDPAIHRMMDAVHRYEGTVNQVLGDGIMALFGAPLAHEDHAIRACYAALAMQAALHDYTAEVRRTHGMAMRIRVGLNSGEVVVRAIGNDLHMDYSAVGQTTHLAARMEQLATPGSVCLTAHTLRLVEGLVEVKPLGAQAVKGFSEPLEVWALMGVTTARTRWQATLRRGLTPFVGREAALHALHQALTHAQTGHGQLAAVVGEPAIGKSRLVYEFSRSAATQGWVVLTSSSVSYGKATTWLPVSDLLKRYFQLDDRDDPQRMADKVTATLASLDQALTPSVPAFLALFDVSIDNPDWRALGAMQQRRRTLNAIQALVIRESQGQPLLLVFEDLHWIDSETQAVLNGLVESLPTCRLLLLVSYRPEYTHTWGNRTYYTQVRIDPLARDDANALLTALLGDDPGVDDLKHLLIGRTAGNPLFLEESVRTLVETGTLHGEPGAYCLARAPGALAIPATVQAIIAERIDRLTLQDKRLLQAAAVIGHSVPLRVLAAIAARTDDDLQRSLTVLQAAEFLYQAQLFPEFTYTFKHALTHQVAYNGLLQEQRRQLHARVADAMQVLYPERQLELAEVLTGHYERGEVWDQALAYSLLAAGKGKEKYTYASASSYAQKALAIAERLPGHQEERRHALVLSGDLASLMGELDAANIHYAHALALATDAAHHQHIANRVHHRHFASRDGAKIAFYEHGSGHETLFFVSPTAYRVAMFQPAVEALCQEFRIVTLDPRGTGASDPIPDLYPLRQRVEDLRAVIETLNGGPVIGVGLSLAGAQLVRLCWAYPGLIKKLLLVGTTPSPREQLGAGFPHSPEEHRQEDALGRGDFSEFEEYLTAFAYRIFSEPEAHDLAEEYIQVTLRLPRAMFRNFAAAASEPDRNIVPLLADIHVPTLVAHGTADREVPFAAARYIVERLPNAQLYAFEGKWHLPLYTATHEFCEVLRRFVRTGTVPESPGTDA